jgi:hypothetical protein
MMSWKMLILMKFKNYHEILEFEKHPGSAPDLTLLLTVVNDDKKDFTEYSKIHKRKRKTISSRPVVDYSD